MKEEEQLPLFGTRLSEPEELPEEEAEAQKPEDWAITTMRRESPFARQIAKVIRHLSFSSIERYKQCPFSWYQSYVVKDRKPSVEAVVFGSAVHKTWADYHIMKSRGESPDLSQIWHAEFGKELAERETKYGGVDWGDGDQEQTYRDGLALVDTHAFPVKFLGTQGDGDQDFTFAHITTFMDMFPPIATKSKYSFEPPDEGEPGVLASERFAELWIPGVEKKLLGYIDWVGAGGIAHDLKTAARSWSDGMADKKLQPTLYLALLQANAPWLAHPELIFKYVVIVRLKKGYKGQVITTRRTPGQIAWALKIVARTWQDMRAGRIVPNPEFMWCGPRCEYWDQCLGNHAFVDEQLFDKLGFEIPQPEEREDDNA